MFIFYVYCKEVCSTALSKNILFTFFGGTDVHPKGRFTHTMPFPCHHPAITLPLPCHSHWPLQSEIGMLLITNFLKLGVVAAKAISWKVANMPSTCHHPAVATLP
jgi:hypothetical protein